MIQRRVQRDKEQDLTQSYDESPYTNKNATTNW